MQALNRVSHEHHDRLRGFVNQLNDLAGSMNCDCLDSGGLGEQLPRLRQVHEGLVTQLIPHMEAVEAAVYPTLERLAADRNTTAPLAREHQEIRRLVGALGEFAENPGAHEDRYAVLALRRVLFRLYALLQTHLAEEEMYIPILEDRLTPVAEAALARALDHLAAERF
jgi:Hemerythrin HHE cation binding domain